MSDSEEECDNDPKCEDHHPRNAEHISRGIVVSERLHPGRTNIPLSQSGPPPPHEILPEREVKADRDKNHADQIDHNNGHGHDDILSEKRGCACQHADRANSGSALDLFQPLVGRHPDPDKRIFFRVAALFLQSKGANPRRSLKRAG